MGEEQIPKIPFTYPGTLAGARNGCRREKHLADATWTQTRKKKKEWEWVDVRDELLEEYSGRAFADFVQCLRDQGRDRRDLTTSRGNWRQSFENSRYFYDVRRSGVGSVSSRTMGAKSQHHV